MDNAKQKEEVRKYLQSAHIGARMMHDIEMETRLSRAIAAFEADIEENIFKEDFLPLI